MAMAAAAAAWETTMTIATIEARTVCTGIRTSAALLCADLRTFTARGEQRAPDDLVAVLDV